MIPSLPREALQRPGPWLRGVYHLARRELLSLFVTPLAYLVGTLFLLNQGWNFALLLRVLNDPLAAPGPVMQFYFGGSFFIFWLPVIFICAALSMRLIAEERRQGTLEALLTAPGAPFAVVRAPSGSREYATGPRTLREFAETVWAFGDSPFLVAESGTYTYAEFFAAACALARRHGWI